MAKPSPDDLAAKLEDPSADLKSKHEALIYLRDNLDRWCSGTEYKPFLQRWFPLLMRLLNGPPVFTSTAYEHGIRNTVLEVFHRLPASVDNPMEQFVSQLVAKLMELIKIENEDNATLCIKIIMDLQRHHTQLLNDKAQPFLDIIQEIFRGTSKVVRETFGSAAPTGGAAGASGPSQYSASPRPGSSADAPAQSGDSNPEGQQVRHLAKGMQSFKVISECPIVVVSVFQTYRSIVNENVKNFVPLIKGILMLQAPPQEQAHREAAAHQTIHIGIAKEIKNRTAFIDFITAQIKTMSFLAYLLRQFGEQSRDFLPNLPDIVVRLLRDCPKERCSNRKELLVAIRHIINFNFRTVFLKSINELLDERTMFGDGLTVHESLRPLGYSLLADLIHHVREKLTADQIRRTVEVYTKNLGSTLPGTSFQSMSAKLLLNMAELIANLEDKKEARHFLITILDSIGDKFAAMNQQYPNAVKISKQLKQRQQQQPAEKIPDDFLAEKEYPPDWDSTDIFTTSPIKVTNMMKDRAADPVTDNKFLFKNLVMGLKNIFYQLRACNPPNLVDQAVAPPGWSDCATGFSAEEVQVLIKLFHEGTRMFQYYEPEKWPPEEQMSMPDLISSHHVHCEKEEKELLETFATIFHHVDPATFHEAFHSEIPHLYEMMFTHPAILNIPQFLLASEATSPSFAGMLLQFLMEHIEDVGSTDVIKASILLRFFKLSFMAVTLFSAHNETVLLPHVNKLVTQSIKLSTTTASPMHYFYLLRSLFRSIGGGRFEHLYKEILPLLEMLLEVLNNLISAARRTVDRDLFVELSLTVPARLSNLLPHLSYLMKPLVLALRAGSELVGQGLRTLELCVDNLTESYLDPIMAPVIDELMAALWEHLQPHPYSHFHAHTTMRILGKLGGRNRKFLEGPPKLTFEQYSDQIPQMDIMLTGSSASHKLPFDLGSNLAIAKLEEVPTKGSSALKPSDLLQKEQALKLIMAHVKLLIRPDTLPSNLDQLVRVKIADMCKDDPSSAPGLPRGKDRGKSVVKRDIQQDQLKKLIKACLYACSIKPLASQATEFMQNLYRHFAVLDIAEADLHAKRIEKDFNVNAGEGEVVIGHKVLIHAIVETLASDNIVVREAAEEAIMAMKRAAVTLFGSEEHIDKMPFFTELLATCSHNCYGEEWFTKAGGANGINILATRVNLRPEFFEQKQLDTCRALMYAAKDLPDTLPVATRTQALSTLEVIVQICNRNAKKEDLDDQASQLSQLSGFLVYELAHISQPVREAAQNALAALASKAGVEVHDIIKPVWGRFSQHIFSKPLRALISSVQIGYIEAVAYCLRLGHDMVAKEHPQTVRFLRETIVLAESHVEENSLFSAKTTTDQRTYDNAVRLKVSCLGLLSHSLDFPEFSNNTPPARGRSKLVSVFFKLLYNKSFEVVEAANMALQHVLEKDPKLPKEVLQTGLRPILISLQDPSKVSISGLHCLARMLKLLKTYFKVEIGGRLLDNISHFASASVLQKESFTLVEQSERIKTVAAALNIYHLLPAGAHSFMGKYLDKVLELERQLRRTQFSPLRDPTIKYVNSYPKDGFEHLFEPRNKEKSTFFAQLLADEASGPLRDAVAENIASVIGALSFEGTGTDKWLATINAIAIITSFCKFEQCRELVLRNDQYRKAIGDAGKSLEQYLKGTNTEPSLRIPAEQAVEKVMNNMIAYLKMEPQDLDTLFEIIEAVTTKALPQSPCLFNFIYTHCVASESVEHWRNIVTRCIDIYTNRSSIELLKASVIRYLVNPILSMDVMRNWSVLFGQEKGTRLVNTRLAEMIQNKLWKPHASIEPSDEYSPQGVDQARMELLQMTAILLKYYNHLLQDFRRDVIKLGWAYIRLEDVINKHAAYVVLAYFVHHFETPPKISSQIYSQLMKAHAPEGKALITQALGILAPVIPKRIGHNDLSKAPLWATYARKPIQEDPSNIQQMTSIFQFVARNPELFYDAKEHFGHTIIQTIYKVAPPPMPNSNPSLDNKKLALQLISLIWDWEERSAQEATSKQDVTMSSPSTGKRRADGSPVASGSFSFINSQAMRLSMIKYLVSFIANLSDRYAMPSSQARQIAAQTGIFPQSSDIAKKALALFYDLISPGHWSDLDLTSIFGRVIEPNLTNEPKADDKYELGITRVINTLRLLNAIVACQTDDWIVARLPQMQKILDKPLRNPHIEIQECLYVQAETEGSLSRIIPLIPRILNAIPNGTPEPDAEDQPQASPFVSFLSTITAETLSASHNLPGVNALKALLETNPSEIDAHFPAIMKALGSYTKDLITPPELQQDPSQPGARPEQPPQQVSTQVLEGRATMILKIIDLLSARLAQLQESRRPYLQLLTTLIEKAPVDSIHVKILELVEKWVFNTTAAVPTLKEKTAVVLKMNCYESRSDQTMFNRYLDIIIRIYEDSKITRSELAIRLEPAFLIGTRAQDTAMRHRFMTVFNRHLTRTSSKRLLYLLGVQNWEPVADTFWLQQIIELLFGSIHMEEPANLARDDFRLSNLGRAFSPYASDGRIGDQMLEEGMEKMMSDHRQFCADMSDLRAKHLLEPLCFLQHIESKLSEDIWNSLFPVFWSILNKDERGELQNGLIGLLTRDYHSRQIDKRPNCAKALLEGIASCENPRINFPHHLMKFLARTYNAWYIAACFMEKSAEDPIVNTQAVRESNLDALCEIYAGLKEDDMFYGVWRKRAQFLDTTTALSYEQYGNWDKAQKSFEQATLKARTGAIPFTQSEYMLWEDHWVYCAEKLQQWDILSDFAKNDNLNDLFLDSIWRNLEWWNNPEHRKQLEQIIKGVSDAPTPRRAFFQSFMSLLKLHAEQESATAFNRVCDEAIQLSIRKWHQLPTRITNAHVPILQSFQQLVELHDASIICQSLQQTTAQNLEHKSPELKLLLVTWRDRLPNFWDDINAWQDLVTWRQHIFQLINQRYLGLIPQPHGNNVTGGNSFAYRGYHETAWIINRFAHVARKHNLSDVCINQLSKIYTLPNIEIQEAFLKLREQAKCHYQNSELQVGLDVINNTNLNYFGPHQKAEFYTLKGMFLARQEVLEDANVAFGAALYFEIKLPKAWAEWARYNDKLFKDTNDISKAADAVSCYLEAAGTYKNAKSRKLLSRLLWLLSLDDEQGTLVRTFAEYKGEHPVWYWITYIPQLLTSLSRPEAKISANLLMKLAKQAPQALFFQLRTSKDDYQQIKRHQDLKARQSQPKEQAQQSSPPKEGTPSSRPQTGTDQPPSRPGTATNGQKQSNGESSELQAKPEPMDVDEPSTVKMEDKPNGDDQNGQISGEQTMKQPWDYVDDISSVMKTAYPLLALTMETMTDQIIRNLKCSPDEDAYRLIGALLNDSLGYVGKSPVNYAHDSKLPQNTELHIVRFKDSVLPAHIRKPFEEEFLKPPPSTYEYIQKLRKWRDRFEEKVDRRIQHTNIENYGPHLSEFKFTRFDDVEVPGQYLEHKDNAKDFIKIERFLPDIELLRGIGVCQRRLKIRGHDGSIHPFAIQHPATRSSRREERMVQMFRMWNDVLAKRKESRRRRLQFTLPAMIPCTPSLRMVQDDSSYISLQGIWEDYCRKKGTSKDEPVLFSVARLRELNPKTAEAVSGIRLQTFEAIQNKFVPKDIVLKYFQAAYKRFDDFWLFRRQFSYQLASLSFLTYVMVMRDRNPSRMFISRETGNVWGTELVPSMSTNQPVFHNGENIPFRLTPNLQTLMGTLSIEGIFSPTLLVVAKALTEPEFKLEQQLSIFIRDEVLGFFTQNHKTGVTPQQLRQAVEKNTDTIIKRALALAKAPEGNLPANQTVIDYISRAVNPAKLAQIDALWMPYL